MEFHSRREIFLVGNEPRPVRNVFLNLTGEDVLSVEENLFQMVYSPPSSLTRDLLAPTIRRTCFSVGETRESGTKRPFKVSSGRK